MPEALVGYEKKTRRKNREEPTQTRGNITRNAIRYAAVNRTTDYETTVADFYNTVTDTPPFDNENTIKK